MGRRKYWALVLAALLLLGSLSGCSAFIEGTYMDIRPHRVEPLSDLDAEDYITVSSQEELEQALWNMIRVRRESRLFRILHLDGATTMEAAWQEVQLRPLAAFAVSSFNTRILSEWQGVTELELVISYQKTNEQIAGVRTVNSADNASVLLGQMLRNGETYLAMLCPVTIANVGFLEAIIRDHYYHYPLEIVVFPQSAIHIYPSSGSGNQRIAEVVLDFGFDRQTLDQMRRDLYRSAHDLIGELPESLTPPEQMIWLTETLSNQVIPVDSEDHLSGALPFVYDEDVEDREDIVPDEPSPLYHTAFGALVMGQASSEGLARSFQALAGLLGMDSQVVRGKLHDLPHVWNIVAFEGYYYHIDVSMLQVLGPELTLFVPDEVMMFQNGYSWDVVLFPRADSDLRYSDFTE